MEYESRSAWTTIALIAAFIVPLLVGICCVVSRVYRRSGRLSLRYQSARAAKRRNSVMALSTMDLSGAGVGGRDGGDARRQRRDAEDGNGDDDDDEEEEVISGSGSVPSSTNPRRSYDAVYRTHEPLPGKPDVVFEPKVWDLDAEYEGQLNKVDKRTAIYVAGSPPQRTSSTTPAADKAAAPVASTSAGPSVAVQKQILPSKFRDLF